MRTWLGGWFVVAGSSCAVPAHLVRGWAQEVISSHLQGQTAVRDQLLEEYCCSADGALLEMMLAFFRSAVHVDQPETAGPRFEFAMYMLGDLIGVVAGKVAVGEIELAVEMVAADCEPEMNPTDRTMIQAAQVALVSHMQVRKGGRPLGVQRSLAERALSDLVGGVMVLTGFLCSRYRAQVGDAALITFLLPNVARLLEMAASGYQMSVHEYTQELWRQLLLGDCQGRN